MRCPRNPIYANQVYLKKSEGAGPTHLGRPDQPSLNKAIENLKEALSFRRDLDFSAFNQPKASENLKNWVQTEDYLYLFNYVTNNLPLAMREIIFPVPKVKLRCNRCNKEVIWGLRRDGAIGIKDGLPQLSAFLNIGFEEKIPPCGECQNKGYKTKMEIIKRLGAGLPLKVLSVYISPKSFQRNERVIAKSFNWEGVPYVFKSWWRPKADVQMHLEISKNQDKVQIPNNVVMIFYEVSLNPIPEVPIEHSAQMPAQMNNQSEFGVHHIDRAYGHRQNFNRGAPKGLANLGNTDYMNSVLQCLINLPQFASVLRSQQERSHPLGNALWGIITAQNQGMDLSRALNEFKYHLDKHLPQFSSHNPNDVKYFFLQLMGVLQNCAQLFFIRLRQTWKCGTGHPNVLQDTIPFVNVNRYARDKQNEISKGLQDFFQCLYVSLFCDKCQGNKVKIDPINIEYPEILIVHLSEMEMDLHQQTDYPLQIYLSPIAYRLKAVVKTSAAHATALAEVNRVWYEFDDLTVRPCRNPIHNDAVLLFYSG